MVNDDEAQAKAAWIEAKHRSDAAQEAARIAEDITNQRFADYAEITQPGFAHYFRRVLKKRQSIFNRHTTEGKIDAK